MRSVPTPLALALLLLACAHDPCCGRRGLVPECPTTGPNPPDGPQGAPVVRDANVIVDGEMYGINYVDDGVNAIYGGDIILGPASALRPTPGRSSMTPELGRRWANRTVPYVIDASAVGFTADINAGIAMWTAATTMQFPLRTTETDYIVFRSTTDGWGSSNLGRAGGEQTIYLPSGTSSPLVAHEIGHALGLWHEHQRPDRDQYIDVNFDNIADPTKKYAFTRDPWTSTWVGGPYDFASIMHYWSCAFAKNGTSGCLPTLTHKDGSHVPWNAAVTDRDACGVLQIYDVAAFNASCNDVGGDCRREQGGFIWNCDDKPAATGCVAIEEPADPHAAWDNDWLCPPEGLQLSWSYAGELPGKRCVAVLEGAEPPEATWTDNYLCWRSTDYQKDHWRFQWSMAGPIADMACLQWAEPADPATWNDNYLCWSRVKWPDIKLELTDIDDDAYVWIGDPADPAFAKCEAHFSNGSKGSKTCDLGSLARQQKVDRTKFSVKIGNGGLYNSQGRVRILVDGVVVKDETIAAAVRHSGWFYRLVFEINAQVGTYQQISEQECGLPTDCMN